jgi:hypothetical protein
MTAGGRDDRYLIECEGRMMGLMVKVMCNFDLEFLEMKFLLEFLC